jgi:hypothetical protein
MNPNISDVERKGLAEVQPGHDAPAFTAAADYSVCGGQLTASRAQGTRDNQTMA